MHRELCYLMHLFVGTEDSNLSMYKKEHLNNLSSDNCLKAEFQ